MSSSDLNAIFLCCVFVAWKWLLSFHTFGSSSSTCASPQIVVGTCAAHLLHWILLSPSFHRTFLDSLFRRENMLPIGNKKLLECCIVWSEKKRSSCYCKGGFFPEQAFNWGLYWNIKTISFWPKYQFLYLSDPTASRVKTCALAYNFTAFKRVVKNDPILDRIFQIWSPFYQPAFFQSLAYDTSAQFYAPDHVLFDNFLIRNGPISAWQNGVCAEKLIYAPQKGTRSIFPWWPPTTLILTRANKKTSWHFLKIWTHSMLSLCTVLWT